MSDNAQVIVVATNGARSSLAALAYGGRLARQLGKPVRLVGVVERPERRTAVSLALDDAARDLTTYGVSHSVHTESGDACDVLGRMAGPDTFLLVFGPLGGPRWRRWLRGRPFRRIMQRVGAPLIYTAVAPPTTANILLCMGGLGYAGRAERLALAIAQASAGRVTILHVVEPASFEYDTARRIQANWQNILETDTPQGRHLRLALARAEEAGVETSFKVRHGDIVHEIRLEMVAGGYDLVAMGSPTSARSLRHRFKPNISAQVAEGGQLPVLIAPL